MEGSIDFEATPAPYTAPRRVPKVGERVLVQIKRSKWREGEILNVAIDRDGEVGRVKARYTGWHGMGVDEWVWAFEVLYLDQEQS